LRGELESAIKSRQSEIRRILELHSVVQGSSGWNYVFHQYDYRDISDRIDLLATLYARMGDYEEAIKILEESRSFCASHEIPFDGEDLLEEFIEKGRGRSDVPVESTMNKRVLDSTIIAVYKQFNQSADQILVDEQKSRQFTEEVLSRLPEGMQVPNQSVKLRLMTLKKTGEDRGGLPRLRRRA
jgi:hypothetical protein